MLSANQPLDSRSTGSVTAVAVGPATAPVIGFNGGERSPG